MTNAQITAETSVSKLKEWLNDARFWAWNAGAEGSARGVTLWENRSKLIEKRILKLLNESV